MPTRSVCMLMALGCGLFGCAGGTTQDGAAPLPVAQAEPKEQPPTGKAGDSKGRPAGETPASAGIAGDPKSLPDKRGLDFLDEPLTAITSYRSTYAIIIGIDEYPGDQASLAPLMFAVNDAREVRALLRDEFGFADERVRYLIDREATLAAVRQAFETWLPQQNLQEADAVLVFFAGHGLIDRQSSEGYLALADSHGDKLRERCLPLSWVRDQLAKLNCRHKLMILDSCYSGSLFQERPAEAAPRPAPPAPAEGDASKTRGDGAGAKVGDNLAYYLNRRAFWGVSAGRFTPVADGLGAQRHSVFTASLLNVLRERADSPRPDQAFTLRQLAAQVETDVANALGSRQIPDWGRLGAGDGDIVFRPTVVRPTPRQRARQANYFGLVAAAEREWRANNLLQARRLLADCPAELRDWEWHYVRRLCYGDELTLRMPGAVTQVTVNSDGSLVAGVTGAYTGGKGGVVTVWDTETGKEIRSFQVGSDSTSDLVFHPQRNHLACAVRDTGKIIIWDVDTGAELRQLSLRQVSSLAYSPDGELLAGGTDSYRHADGKDEADLQLWNAANGQDAGMLPRFPSPVHDLDFSRDGKRLAVAGGSLLQGHVRIYGVQNRQMQLSYQGHNSTVFAVAFHPDGKRVASSGYDNLIKVWDATSGEIQFTLDRHDSPVVDLAFTPDGRRLASASWDHSIKVWDMSNTRELFTLRGHSSWVSSVAFMPQGDRLISGSRDRTIKLWDGETGNQAITMSGQGAVWITALAFHPRGRRLAAAPKVGDGIWIWQANIGIPGGNLDGSDAVAFSPEGDRLAAGFQDSSKKEGSQNGVRIWDEESRKLLLTLDHPRSVNAVAYSSFGRWLATASMDSHVRIFDAATGKLVRTLEGHDAAVYGLAFRADGQVLATGSADRSVRLWEVATGKLLRTLKAPQHVWSVAISPDGRQVAAAAGQFDQPGRVLVWSTETGELQLTITGHTDNVTAVAFSPNGRRIASASFDKTVRLWDASTGQEAFVLRGHGPAMNTHGHEVTSLAFRHDGWRLATAGRDGTIKVWNAAPLEQEPPEPAK